MVRYLNIVKSEPDQASRTDWFDIFEFAKKQQKISSLALELIFIVYIAELFASMFS